jgi:hypothetical protein
MGMAILSQVRYAGHGEGARIRDAANDYGCSDFLACMVDIVGDPLVLVTSIWRTTLHHEVGTSSLDLRHGRHSSDLWRASLKVPLG